MKFSVVISAYNVANYLGALLDALLSQYESSFEVIVVDDASTDATARLADSYLMQFIEKGCSYRVISHEQNQGLSAARNTGLASAVGEYILFLDADDEVEPSLLTAIRAKLEECKAADFVIFGYTEDYYLGEKLNYQVHKFPSENFYGELGLPLTKAYEDIITLEQETIFGYAWNKAYRLDFLRENKFRFEDIKHIEDVLFNIQVMKKMSSMLTLDFELYHYKNRGQSRLTGKYIPEYFSLQKRRYQEFIEAELSLEGGDARKDKLLQTMAAAYFRSMQSYIVRELGHGAAESEIIENLEQEVQSEIYQQLRSCISSMSAKQRLLYKPLAKGRFATAIRRAKLIAFVQKNFSGLYSRLKQNR